MRALYLLTLVTAIVLSGCDTQPAQRSDGIDLQIPNRLNFKSDNPCPPPGKASYGVLGGVRTFTLRGGDIGTCAGDDKPKKSFVPVAPYVERNEYPAVDLEKGNRYLISVLVNFDPEFASSKDTTFFQIAQWQKDECECGALIRLSLDKSGGLFASVLRGHYRYKDFKLGNLTRADLENKWVEVALDLNTGKNGSVAVFVGGVRTLSTTMHVQKGTRVGPKVGLLRPGSTAQKLPTDRVRFRDLRYVKAVAP